MENPEADVTILVNKDDNFQQQVDAQYLIKPFDITL